MPCALIVFAGTTCRWLYASQMKHRESRFHGAKGSADAFVAVAVTAQHYVAER
jgi:hypothetical protein